MPMNGTVALVAGRAALVFLALGALALTLFVPGAAQSAAGQPDAGFGIQGSLNTDLQGGSSERCFELLIQGDGKLVCVGQSARRDASAGDVALVRYLPSGRLDPTFGSGGVALFDSGLGGDDVAASAVLTADGKFVVAGVADVSGADRQDFFLARFNSDGSIDSSFGTGGFIKTDGSPKSPDLDWAYAVALQHDGKIVVAGQTTADRPGEALTPALLRYTRNGELDRSFGTDGKAVLTRAHGELARALLVQQDGKILLGSSINRPPARFVVARFDHSGRLDRRFGAGGIASAKIGFGNGQLEALARQRDGKIVAAGWGVGPRDVGVLTRFHSNGDVDRRFGTAGTTVTRLIDALPETGIFALALQRDGRIVVAGGHAGSIFAARYLENGTPDTEFGGVGFVVVQTPGKKHGYASAARIQRDGRIVIAGAASARPIRDEDFALVRLASKSAPGTRFASFTARTTTRGVVIRWRTRTEDHARRFLLYRREWGGRRLVGQVIAQGGPRHGATYSMTDHSARNSSCCTGYWLVEVKRDGRRISYGPVAR